MLCVVLSLLHLCWSTQVAQALGSHPLVSSTCGVASTVWKGTSALHLPAGPGGVDLVLFLVPVHALRTALGTSLRDLVCYAYHHGAVVLDINDVVQTSDAAGDAQTALAGQGVCILADFLSVIHPHRGQRMGTLPPPQGAGPPSTSLCPSQFATPGLQVASTRTPVDPSDWQPDTCCQSDHGPGSCLWCAPRRLQATSPRPMMLIPWSRIALHLHHPRTYHFAMWASTLGSFPGVTSAFVEGTHSEGDLFRSLPATMCLANALVDTLLVRYLEPTNYLLSHCALLKVPEDGTVRRQLWHRHASPPWTNHSADAESAQIVVVPHGAAPVYFAASDVSPWNQRRQQALVPLHAVSEKDNGCGDLLPLRFQGELIHHLEQTGRWHWRQSQQPDDASRDADTAPALLTATLPHPGWCVVMVLCIGFM